MMMMMTMMMTMTIAMTITMTKKKRRRRRRRRRREEAEGMRTIKEFLSVHWTRRIPIVPKVVTIRNRLGIIGPPPLGKSRVYLHHGDDRSRPAVRTVPRAGIVPRADVTAIALASRTAYTPNMAPLFSSILPTGCCTSNLAVQARRVCMEVQDPATYRHRSGEA